MRHCFKLLWITVYFFMRGLFAVSFHFLYTDIIIDIIVNHTLQLKNLKLSISDEVYSKQLS